MNKKIELGVVNSLKIDRVTEPGLYLVSEDEEEAVLLPNAYITSKMNIGDVIDVFIYTDSEDRLVATTLTPYAYKNQFALLEVVDVSKFGAFVDLGLPKDLLVPKNRQKNPFSVGEKRFIRVIEDEKTQRLIGVEKFSSFISRDIGHFQLNDEVDILLFAKTPLGFKVVANNSFEGMIFHNEIFEVIKVGARKKAYVKQVRDDGKLDLALQKIGSKSDDETQEKVLAMLEKNSGFLPYNSKSDAEAIKKIFGLSKKNFKAVLTKLITQDKIENVENGIKLKK
ncbi:MAG: S1 RNA-binding domain-containing protein [Candidatus Marinarcus sp.]|uniref:CvfB family protein n=1 Tax=Candidatus Marinarcus sp. TaxID=3100987 RepID=UPI003AFF811E